MWHLRPHSEAAGKMYYRPYRGGSRLFFGFLGRKHEVSPTLGCSSNPRHTATPTEQWASALTTLFGEEPESKHST